MIKIKRIYEANDKSDGFRILVDRLWPRGTNKEKPKIDLWLREIAPSNELRKWFNHDPLRWDDFKKKYFKELENKKLEINRIIDRANTGDVILLYAAKG